MAGLRTCNKCGWVHFAVSRKHAEDEVATFKVYFDGLSKEIQDSFYGGQPSKIRDYEHCMVCDTPYTDFRDSKHGDVPDGCTMSPIIDEGK